MKVLVADDDLDQLTLRCLLLERNGFETLQASDAASALALAQSEHPQCAVMDLRFPDEESGFRLVRDLKALETATRIILLTGTSPGKLAARPELDLVDEVVQKSSGTASLIRMLKSVERTDSG
jgi:two-component system, response regulator RegA